METLHDRIATGKARVGVVGLGYVGIPLVSHLLGSFESVVGLDIDDQKIAAIQENRSYLPHLGAEVFDQLCQAVNLTVSTDMSLLSTCDAVIITVPTPLGPHHEPDLGAVVAAGRSIGQHLPAEQLIVLESTTYPGTTRGPLVDAIAEASESRLALGEHHFVAYSPERENPGGGVSSQTVPKLVGGLDATSTELAQSLYTRAIDQVIAVSSAEVAEAAKLLENIFRAVNIAMVNEMKVVLTDLDIDIWEVIQAASSKPFGYTPFFPGPGLGGHCIPIDPFYLAWRAREVGHVTRFIELAGQVNRSMPDYVLSRLVQALNVRGVATAGAHVLLIGLAYKAGVADTRESPGIELANRLIEWGATVSYHDPLVLPDDVGTTQPIAATDLSPQVLRECDAVLIATHQPTIDYSSIAQNAKLVVDTRNAMKDFRDVLGDRLVTA